MTYTFIDTQADLSAFCKLIEADGWFAIDTEFVRTDTYFPKLCLIQIQSRSGHAAIIDPMAFDALEPLWQLLENPNIRKVFHSARQDIEVLYQVSGRMPEAIYDTQIAGVFLGYGDLAGLAKVIKAELDIELEKDQTRTDWSRRPLTDKQLEYAINDVRYLAPLYERYLDKLTEAQQAALTEDFEALLNEDLYRLAPENAADKIKAVQKLPRKAQAIAYRLAEWRELYAINHNKPKRWVLSDDALVAIAKRPPKAREALYKVPNIKASSVKNFGDEWIEIIDDVFANPDAWPEAPNKLAPATPQEDIFINIGFALLQQVAQDYHINPPNIAGKTDLLRLIRQPEARLAGWRQALFGQPFSEFLKGNIGLTCDNQRLIQKTFTP